MAQVLGDAQGIVTDVNFLNNERIGDGETVIGEHIHQDIIQFFQKIMNLAGISPNGTFDNETNGYQFIDALKVFNKYYRENFTDGAATEPSPGWSVLGRGNHVFINPSGHLLTDQPIIASGSFRSWFPAMKIGPNDFNYPANGLGAEGVIASEAGLKVWNALLVDQFNVNSDGDITKSKNINFSGKLAGANAAKVLITVDGAGALFLSSGSETVVVGDVSKLSTGTYEIKNLSGVGVKNIEATVDSVPGAPRIINIDRISASVINVYIYDNAGVYKDSSFTLTANWES